MCKACLVTSKFQDLEEKKSWSTCCNMELMCMLKMMVGSVYYYSFHFHTIYHLAIPISHFWVIIDIFFKGGLVGLSSLVVLQDGLRLCWAEPGWLK